MIRTAARALLLALAGAALAAEAPRPDDYAYGWTVRLGAPAEFHRLPLSREVLAAARSPALADLALFDDDGRLVPAFVMHPEPPKAGPQPTVMRLPAYSLAEQARQEAVRRGVTVQIASPDGMTVAVATEVAPTPADPPAAALSASGADDPGPGPGTRRWYSIAEVDAAGTEAASWETLVVEWQGVAGAFISAVELETSDDLQRWRPIGQGAIAAFGVDGNVLKRERVPVTGPVERFVRMTLRDLPAGWQIVRFTLEHEAPLPELEREWQALAFTEAAAPLMIDLGAPLRVDRFEVALGAAGMVRAKLEAADAPEGPWRFRGHALFYRFEQGPSPATSTAIGVDGAAARHWRVTLLGHGGGPAEVRLGWRPSELVFVAQGRKPFHLVAGNLAQSSAAPEVGALADDARRLWQAQQPEAGAAELGPRHELAGSAAYDPRPLADWKTYALWALLIAGVVGVLAMAFRLRRELAGGGDASA